MVLPLTLLPFAANSVWRLGAPSAPTLHPVTSEATVAVRRNGVNGDGRVWINRNDHSHPVDRAASSDPLATITDTVHANLPPFTARIPASATIAAGTDKHMHVIQPDGYTLVSMFYVQRQSTTAYTCARFSIEDLRGPGIGPQGGTRAYGGSALGGLIRAWEVDPAHPDYTGKIEHPLAIALRNDQLYFDAAKWASEPSSTDNQRSGYIIGANGGVLKPGQRPGWPDNTPSAGFMWQPGYQYPATEQDYDSPFTYDAAGRVPMGAYFVIPGNVDVTAQGFTPAGVTLAKAAQDYGVYVTDRAGTAAFYVEYTTAQGAEKAWTDELLNSQGAFNAGDPRKVLSLLRHVDQNTPSSPNGAPVGAARRATGPATTATTATTPAPAPEPAEPSPTTGVPVASRVKVTDPTWINNGTNAREARVGIEGLLLGARNYGRGGLLAAENPVAPTVPASTRSRITPCWVAVPRPGQGVWLVPVETTVTLDHDVPSSAGARIDLVVARVYDTEAGDAIPTGMQPPLNPDGTRPSGIAVLEVLTGVAGGGAPVLPPGTLLLRVVTMPAGAGSVLSTVCFGAEGPIATARGGIAVVHSQAEQDQLDSYEGMTVLRRDDGTIQTRWQGIWQPTQRLGGRDVYQPILRGNGQQVNLGQGGFSTGRADVVGREMRISFFFRFGSTGVDGKTGTLTCDLPTGVRAASVPQEIRGTVYCPEQDLQYGVILQVAAGATFGTFAATSAYNDGTFRAMRNTNPATPTQAGTGVPKIDTSAGGPSFVLQNNGNIVVHGVMEIAG